MGQILASKKNVKTNSIPTLPGFFQTVALNTEFSFWPEQYDTLNVHRPPSVLRCHVMYDVMPVSKLHVAYRVKDNTVI